MEIETNIGVKIIIHSLETLQGAGNREEMTRTKYRSKNHFFPFLKVETFLVLGLKINRYSLGNKIPI